MDTPTFQKLVNNKVFKVPDYQRGYAWEIRHVEDLLEDLETIDGRNHYMSTVVLKKRKKDNGKTKTKKTYAEKYPVYEVVDGQQRFTTLILLLNCIIDEFEEHGLDKRASELRGKYIEKEGPGNKKIQKLELDEDNKDFFKNHIIKENDREIKIKSHRRLVDAKIEINNFLETKENEKDNYREYLKELQEKITQNLIFTQYIIEDDTEAGLIFESLNDRGKDLSQLEKVKNFLLYQVGRIKAVDLTDDINDGWGTILKNLAEANKDSKEDENQFLRYNFILRYYSELSSTTDRYGKRISINSQLSDIHSKIKEKFRYLESNGSKCREEIENYVDSLIEMSRYYKYHFEPYNSNSFQNIKNSEIKNKIKLLSSKLNRLKGTSSTHPLILSINMRFKDQPKKLKELLELCEKFAFLVYYVEDMRSYTARSTARDISNKIYAENLSFEEIKIEIKERMMQKYISQEKIKDRLSDEDKNFYKWDGLTYFLYEYERYRCDEEDKGRPEFEWRDIKDWEKEDTIEHILPKTIRGKRKIKYWADRFDEIEHGDYLRRLGNLVLTTKNSKLSNKSFPEKQKIYQKSNWEIEKDLAKKWGDWTKENIAKREEKLIQFAKERWGFEKMTKQNSFWVNTNKNNVRNIHDNIFDEGIIATYGPEKYKRKLEKGGEGDIVFAYIEGVGIIGFGKIKEEDIMTENIKGNTRYSLPVKWDVVLNQDKAITPSEMSDMGYGTTRGTFRHIRKEDFVKKLKKEIKSRDKE